MDALTVSLWVRHTGRLPTDPEDGIRLLRPVFLTCPTPDLAKMIPVLIPDSQEIADRAISYLQGELEDGLESHIAQAITHIIRGY